jgi:S-methylmethionine-dependent homocysteine/selenocysteine methylase
MTIPALHLPHLSSDLFLTDGGLETTLVFIQGFDLPFFAAFDLLKDESGYRAIQEYYRTYLEIATKFQTRFILESPTWRANPDWMEKIGYPADALAEVNQKAVQLLFSLREEFQKSMPAILISGCIGPRGDGYIPGNSMNAEEAENYHMTQVAVLASAQVDMISAITMTYVEEAIGIARAAGAVDRPCVISFTVETDGKLPTGMNLREAISLVDTSSARPPIYYMINCAHPTHFMDELQAGKDQPWTKRIHGIRANASCKSHAQLDESTELDRGDPHQLGMEHQKLKEIFPHINVFGGCCGTDEEHVQEIVAQLQTTG